MAYGNGLAPKEALVKFEGSWFFEETAKRVKWVVETYRTNRPDGYIRVTQGYRFRGVDADIALGRMSAARDEENAGDTSTGDANQSYEWGRDLAGFTSASPIGQSGHGANPGDKPWGGAVDMDADDVPYRTSLFTQVGMARTAMPSETWHEAVVSDSAIDLSNIIITVAATTPTEEEEIMAVLDDIEAFIKLQTDPINKKLSNLIGTPETQAQFVAQINGEYQKALGRVADPQGMNLYLGLMLAGSPLSDVTAALVGSDEFKSRQIWVLYGQLLNRTPSPVEIQGWLNVMHSGQSIDYVTSQIQGSDEYKRLHP